MTDNKHDGVLLRVRETLRFTIRRMGKNGWATEELESRLAELDALLADVPDDLGDVSIHSAYNGDGRVVLAAKLLASATKENN